MRRLILLLTALLIMSAAHAATAFYRGERVSGMTKLCFYSHLSNEYTITVRAIDVCPLSIEVDMP